MLDAALRPLLARPLEALTTLLDRPGVTPDRLTVAGLVLGLGSAAAAAFQLWVPALVLWLVSRVVDGLDGTLARRRAVARGDAEGGTHAGGFLDIAADFVVYGATVAGVAIGATAGGAPWWPFLLVLLAYYINGTAFLAFSSIAERAGRRIDDGRSLSFLGGLAEATETIAVHALWLILPFWAAEIAVVWAVIVGVSAAQRIVVGYRSLR
ncbi:CDP-alcohol phosphatidyltransferase family protein [Microbacterium sp. ET2]|uniref:CDP-alcohol phosphatidyltransferase family protein n=1 Tax=Microbacterium albipurpureum TaxID=3050384 RepID=UPI00259CA467|nr:CDP-alcohol phosphatidyltransferase family protein [Microbacterium sp. ET2 (Ac-2212)]WJL96693.1 CDP-alcohol phosphatidyltransferase family protein [Microbacterium sp. ET2 (Ac-2212)]